MEGTEMPVFWGTGEVILADMQNLYLRKCGPKKAAFRRSAYFFSCMREWHLSRIRGVGKQED